VIARQQSEIGLVRFGLLELPGVVQAVTTRAAGNLSLVEAERVAETRRNRRHIAELLEIEPKQVVCAHQVHGDRVVRIGRDDRERGAWDRDTAIANADALITDEPDVFPMLLFADCVPILLLDPRRRALGVAHAGWKGTSLSIAARTVEAMGREFGSDPSDLRAAIGPAIGRCCYEVSDDVAVAVQSAAPDAGLTSPGPHGRPHLDLPGANRAQLVAAGLRADNVELSGDCTSCRVDRFFSHRAEHGQAGRHGALLGLRE
jgi:YfiH family protein